MQNLLPTPLALYNECRGARPRATEKIRAWWRQLRQRYQRRQSRKALQSMSDGQLRDIGLTRADLPYKDERKF